MKNIRGFLSENVQFLEVNFSIYLNRRVFVMLFQGGTFIVIFLVKCSIIFHLLMFSV